MKTIKISLALLAVLAFSNCSNKKKAVQPKKEHIVAFNIQAIKPKTIHSTINITGRVIPTKKVNIVAEVQGVIQNTNSSFEDGIRYKKGQLILAINNSELKYSLQAQKSSFLNTLVRTMSDIELDFPKEFSLWNSYLKSINVEKTLPSLPNTTNTQLRLFLSGRNIYNNYYSIKSQEERLKKYRLYAPFDGVVTKAFVKAGDLVSPGVKLGEFISTNEYEVITAISPTNLSALKIGHKIKLNAQETNKTYDATVKRFSEKLDENTQSINVYLSAKDNSLRSGMYLEGALPLASYENAIRVPKNIVSRDNKVFVLENGIVTSKTISLAATEENTVVIQGLSEKDQLITDQVRPIQIGKKAIAK